MVEIIVGEVVVVDEVASDDEVEVEVMVLLVVGIESFRS